MMNQKIRLGISTCPNDTFTFHGLLSGQVTCPGLDLQFELLDVEQLNQRLLAGEFDVAKASFHAALGLTHQVVVLPSGSALGFGVGPLLLAARPETHPRALVDDADGTRRPARVLCPGAQTTATLLYKLFHAGEGELRQAIFSEIMPALQTGAAEFGVCIHEGRFTWREQGLALVEDLGSRWETATGAPLPLGGIVARRALGKSVIAQVQHAIAASLDYALAHRAETLMTMRRYAQEFSDDVLFAHVELYVNAWTRDLGEVGRGALAALSKQASAAGLVPATLPPLEVFDAGA